MDWASLDIAFQRRQNKENIQECNLETAVAYFGQNKMNQQEKKLTFSSV